MVTEPCSDRVSEFVNKISDLTDDLETLARELDDLRDDLIDSEDAAEARSGTELGRRQYVTEAGAIELWAALTNTSVTQVVYSPSWSEIIESVRVFSDEARSLGEMRRELKDEREKNTALKKQLLSTQGARDEAVKGLEWLREAMPNTSLDLQQVTVWANALHRLLDRERRGAVSAVSVQRVLRLMNNWRTRTERAQRELVNGPQDEDDDGDFERYDVDKW